MLHQDFCRLNRARSSFRGIGRSEPEKIDFATIEQLKKTALFSKHHHLVSTRISERMLSEIYERYEKKFLCLVFKKRARGDTYLFEHGTPEEFVFDPIDPEPNQRTLLSITQISESGKEYPGILVSSDNMINNGGVLDRDSGSKDSVLHTRTALIESPEAHLVAMFREDYVQLASDFNEVAKISRALAYARSDALQNRLMMGVSGYTRLRKAAWALSSLIEKHGVTIRNNINVDITTGQDRLAKLVGLNRTELSRSITELEELGYFTREGPKKLIINGEELQALLYFALTDDTLAEEVIEMSGADMKPIEEQRHYFF